MYEEYSFVGSEIVEVIPFPVIVMQKDNKKILYMNAQGWDFFAEEFFVHNWSELSSSALKKEIMQGKEIRNQETILRKKNGEELFVLLSAVNIRYNNLDCLVIFLNDITERKILEEELRRQVITDSLTKISNRRYFIERFEREIKQVVENKNNLSLILIDVDRFKKINDTYGHQIGDAVLKQIAQTLEYLLGSNYPLARIGGEEFAVILPGLSLEQAYNKAVYLCSEIGGTAFSFANQQIAVTISLGVSSYVSGNSVDEVFSRADIALYEAKELRNCVKKG